MQFQEDALGINVRRLLPAIVFTIVTLATPQFDNKLRMVV